jgi:hypothetical protein
MSHAIYEPREHSLFTRQLVVWGTDHIYGVGCVLTVAVYCSRSNVQRSSTVIEELQELIRTTEHLSVLYSHWFTSQMIGVHIDLSALRLFEDKY